MENGNNWYGIYTQDYGEGNGGYESLRCPSSRPKSLMKDYRLRKISDHLYSIEFDTLDEAYGRSYAMKHFKPVSCSSVRKDGYYGRNFDWYYSNSVEFLVRIGASEGRYASIGISTLVDGLDADTVSKCGYTRVYDAIPYLMVDGMNEKGVVVNTNVVPAGEAGTGKRTTGTNPGKKRIPQIFIVRHVLDNYATAKDAVEGIKNDLDVYAANIEGMNYELHCMIGDKDDNFIVEFVDNKVKVIEGDRANIMTNFHVYGTEIDGGKVDYKTITPFGAGYERYNIALSEYGSITDLGAMKTLMNEKLKYSNAYTLDEGDDFWYTEFVGDYGDYRITVEDCINRVDVFHDRIIPIIKEQYRTRERKNKNVWITCHTSVFDIENKVLWLTSQEGEELSDVGFGFNPDMDYLINCN